MSQPIIQYDHDCCMLLIDLDDGIMYVHGQNGYANNHLKMNGLNKLGVSREHGLN